MSAVNCRLCGSPEVPFVLRYDEAPDRETVPVMPTVAAYLRVIRGSRAR